jgi:hypothetical protein
MPTKSSKTRFVSLEIRGLSKEERLALDVVRDVLCGRVTRDVIGKIPACLSTDNKDRPLVLDKLIVEKIRRDHGNIIAENLVINVHDWDFGIKNMDKDPDKITLVKTIPDSHNYLIAGAKRDNGFFMVTHFEVVSEEGGNQLKSLLGRGDILDRSGVPSRAPATSPIKLEKVSSDNDAELLKVNDSKSESNVKRKKVDK